MADDIPKAKLVHPASYTLDRMNEAYTQQMRSYITDVNKAGAALRNLLILADKKGNNDGKISRNELDAIVPEKGASGIASIQTKYKPYIPISGVSIDEFVATAQKWYEEVNDQAVRQARDVVPVVPPPVDIKHHNSKQHGNSK